MDDSYNTDNDRWSDIIYNSLYHQEKKEENDNESSEDDFPLAKMRRISKRYIKETIGYNYLKLASGEEFYFKYDDGNKIILPRHIESNEYIRKIIANIPHKMEDKLLFLSKFVKNDEKNKVVDVDIIEEFVTADNVNQDDLIIDKNTIFYNLKEQVMNAYLLETRLRTILRRFVHKWRIKNIDKKYTREIDPITLSYPENDIILYDVPNRKKTIFDASSLSLHIETNLLDNDGGFPMPQKPRNPWTNMEFTYGQLFSIYLQIKNHNKLKWGLMSLRQHNFYIPEWKLYHQSYLTMNAIKTSIIKLDSSAARDLLEDFIITKLEELIHAPSEYVVNAYRLAMIKIPNHWYLQECKALAILYYEAEHFEKYNDPLINTRFTSLFAKQYTFISDLILKGII